MTIPTNTDPNIDPKPLAQAKLVSRILAACQALPTATAIDVMGALEAAKFQVAMSGMMRVPPASTIAPVTN